MARKPDDNTKARVACSIVINSTPFSLTDRCKLQRTHKRITTLRGPVPTQCQCSKQTDLVASHESRLPLRVHRREPEARRPVPVGGRQHLHDLDALVLAREAVRPHPRLPLQVHGIVHGVGPQRGAHPGGRGHGARRVHEHGGVADVFRVLPRLPALVQHAHHEAFPSSGRHGAKQLHLHQLAAGGLHQEAALHVRVRAARHGGDDLGEGGVEVVQLWEDVHHPVPRVGVELAPVDDHVDHGGDAGRRHGLPRVVARPRRSPLVAMVQLPVDGQDHDAAAGGGHRDGLLDDGVDWEDATAEVLDLEAHDAGDEGERGNGWERLARAGNEVEQMHLATVVRGDYRPARGAEGNELARVHAAQARWEGAHGDLTVGAHD